MLLLLPLPIVVISRKVLALNVVMFYWKVWCVALVTTARNVARLTSRPNANFTTRATVVSPNRISLNKSWLKFTRKIITNMIIKHQAWTKWVMAVLRTAILSPTRTSWEGNLNKLLAKSNLLQVQAWITKLISNSLLILVMKNSSLAKRRTFTNLLPNTM